MGFFEKSFDLKKFAGAIRKYPDCTDMPRYPDTMGPEDLKPCLLPVYIQILREGSITLADLDLSAIGEGDIDDLESVLHYSPANKLFDISEVFRAFAPSAAAKRAFI